MRLLIIMLLMFFITGANAQDVPFMAQDQYEFKLDYDFKTKPPPEKNKVNLIEESRYSADLLPYVKVNFSFSNLPKNAFRMRVYDGEGGLITTRKLKKHDDLSFDLGYSDDIKDRVKPHAYFIYLENKEKERMSKIKIFVEESGEFYLNDKLYGKI